MNFDYLIVGGGSSGCVLANRLSANPNNQVALLEAGPDTHPEKISDQIATLPFLPHYFDEEYYWTNIEAYVDPVGNHSLDDLRRRSKSRRYEQARVMGGGSTVNAQIAMRGLPSDYDEWRDLGADGWGWEDCLPYFKRLERDMDFGGDLHGKEGPIPIRRTFPSDWGGLSRAFRDALGETGVQYHDDAHEWFGDGCFPYPRNNVYGQRVSSAIGYLDSATRQRPNLHIFSKSFVERIIFEGTRATAVKATRENRVEIFSAREIVICSGALNSPALLMRSGVGPADHLASLGIDVVANNRGVGRNLQEHPLVGIGIHMRPEARQARSLRNNFQLVARYSSDHPDCPPQDMRLSVSNRFAWTKVGEQLGTCQFGPNKAFSQGFVQLSSPDPYTPPVAAFNLLSDPRDLQRTIDAVRFVAGLLGSKPMKSMIYTAFPGVYAEMQRNLTTVSAKNKLLTDVAAYMLDAGGIARSFTMKFVHNGRPLSEVVANENLLVDWIRRGVQGDWHACGTCKMGRASDRMSVVDSVGRVRNVENLRIADASIMPSVPCANTNISTIMIAEKISSHIAAS